MSINIASFRTLIIMKNKRLFIMLSLVVTLLFIPLISMQITDDVNWGPFDFIVAAVLLFGTVFICELILRKVKQKKHRITLCVILFIILLVIWTELSVGIFGSPFAGN